MILEQRGFNFPLEPYLYKLSWDLSKLDRRILQTRQRLSAYRSQQQGLDVVMEQQIRHLQIGQSQRPDPAFHNHGLIYLSRLRLQLQELSRLMQAAQTHLSALQCDRQLLQTKIENLREQRTAALVAYGRSLQRRTALEADRDWLARHGSGPTTAWASGLDEPC